jgi:hypothetical protein
MGYKFIKLVKLSGDTKKYKAVLLNTDTGREKSVKFGSAGMMDYTKYYKRDGKEVADMKKSAYIARHSKNNENWGASGKDTAGFFSRWILWNKSTVGSSLASVKRKFF